jgi:hypothetical protein
VYALTGHALSPTESSPRSGEITAHGADRLR